MKGKGEQPNREKTDNPQEKNGRRSERRELEASGSGNASGITTKGKTAASVVRSCGSSGNGCGECTRTADSLVTGNNDSRHDASKVSSCDRSGRNETRQAPAPIRATRRSFGRSPAAEQLEPKSTETERKSRKQDKRNGATTGAICCDICRQSLQNRAFHAGAKIGAKRGTAGAKIREKAAKAR